MPIDKAQLESYLNELGFTDTVRSSVLAELESKPDAATRFVGQRLRHDDYTRKTQELTQNKQTLETQMGQQIAGYTTELQAANAKIAKIAKDFEDERISRTTAEARLQKVKTTYDLSDDDIPPVTDLVSKPSEPAIDINKVLGEFKTSLMNDIRKDLAAMPNVTATQFDIAAQHQELFGKRMTREEQSELVTLAQKNGTNLQTAWEQKHGVADVRTTKLVESSVAAARTKWEDEQKIANSNAAMSSITSQRESQSFIGAGGKSQSPVLGRQYAAPGEDGTGTGTGVADTQKPGPGTGSVADKSTNAPKLSGAERAAAKWIEKANAGSIGRNLAA